jgi:hypothetical protein
MHDGSDDDDDENADNLYVDVAAPGLLPSTTSTTSFKITILLLIWI